MFRPFVSVVIFLAIVTLLSGCGGGTGGTGGTGGDSKGANPPSKHKKVIAVIPKSTSHEFWRQVNLGADSAAKGKDLEVIFKAGDPGDQAQAQLTLVKQMIAQHVDALVLAPVDSKFLAPVVDDAKEAKIPLVIIDSAIDAPWENYAAYVATENRGGGALCADWLAEALGGKGDVLLFKYNQGSASTTEREDGFRETIKNKYPNIKIIQEKYAGATREDALRSANELLAANPKFDGVFACNESSAVGMLQALREKGLLGKVKYVGFDTAKVLLEAVENGEMVAVAAQNPFLIGSEGVELAITAMEGKKIDPHDHLMGAEKFDKARVIQEAVLQKQKEEEEKREADIKRQEEENKRQLEEQRKKIEADQKNNSPK